MRALWTSWVHSVPAIIAKYEKDKEADAQAKAVEAKSLYDVRHKPSLDRELDEIEPNLRATIDEDHTLRRRQILDARKQSAQASFDAALTRVMDHLIQKRSEQVARDDGAHGSSSVTIWVGSWMKIARKTSLALRLCESSCLVRISSSRRPLSLQLVRRERARADQA